MRNDWLNVSASTSLKDSMFTGATEFAMVKTVCWLCAKGIMVPHQNLKKTNKNKKTVYCLLFEQAYKIEKKVYNIEAQRLRVENIGANKTYM